ncbi:MAG: DUF5686 family protein [Bacteroidales bacterium]|nr:DUF5686 family protein [Bacteroidales bacterium]
MTAVFLSASFVSVAQTQLQTQDVEPLPAYSLTLQPVNITPSNEDPAYAIIRRAVASAPQNRYPVSKYQSKVYSKATLKIDKVPRLLRFMDNFSPELKKIKQGDVYTQEQLMRINSSGEKFECVVVSRKSSFPKEFDGDFSSDFISINPYVNAGELISPLTPQGLAMYRYKLQNILTNEKGQTVYRIQIKARNKNPFAFFGTIDILETLWNVVAFDLSGAISFQIFDATYNIKQQYKEIADNLWMPSKAFLTVNASAMGIKATMNLAANTSVEKFIRNTLTQAQEQATAQATAQKQANAQKQATAQKQASSTKNVKSPTEKQQKKIENIDKKIEEITQKENLSTRDAIKIVSLIEEKSVIESGKDDLEIKRISYVRRKDSVAPAEKLESEWNENYAEVPLTEEETTSYKNIVSTLRSNKDTAAVKANTKPQRSFMFNTFSSIILGSSKKKKIEFELFPLREMYSFNAVDGFTLIPGFSLHKKFKDGQNLTTSAQVGYSFSSKTIPFYVAIDWKYAPKKIASIKVEGGMRHNDFNTVQPLHPYHNTWAGLLGHRSYVQYYQRGYVKATNTAELFNGFDTKVSFTYEWRKGVVNNTEFSFFFPKSRTYQPNLLSQDGCGALVEAEIAYTPRRHYRFNGNRKTTLHSQYPTMAVLWKKGIKGIGKSNTDFDYLQFSVSQTVRKTMLHTFRYNVFGGYFPRKNEMHFSEYYHPALMGTVFFDTYKNMYQVLRNYRASTDEWVAGVNFNYEAMYLIFKFIPWLNKTLITENLYFNYLETPAVRHYVEVGYSINRILMFGDIGFSLSFEDRSIAGIGRGFGYSGWRLHIRLKL